MDQTAEYDSGRFAGQQDARVESFDPKSNPWLPARTRDERDLAHAWADGYIQGFSS